MTTQYFGNNLTSVISGVLSTGLCRPAGVPNNIYSSLGLPATKIPLRHNVSFQRSTNTWTQVYRWLISYITLLSAGTPANIRMYFIFLENKSIGLLHFAPDNIGLSSLEFFWWAQEFLFISASKAFPLFQGIQGH